ncbi:MAG: tetratricopeptide repeat protein [Alphaproteobacteria bacterium]|nr:MAG: tetratricopeptide repeat protein [Alphaproteobacteria bacterium]TMK01391.1 MAG: tetratricopeptide repeat protein [Alphaproteobacteria bacterium]
MSDIFHEVDEEVRREQLKKLWDRYGNYVAAAAVLLVLAVAAWRAYMWWEAKKAAETGAAFEAAITLAESGKRSEAEAAFADIAGHGTSGYRHLARMREAAELAQTDPKAAIAAYDQIAADGSVGHVLQDLALLRAGALLIDAGSYQEAQRRLEPLAANDRTFRHTAREFLVLASWRAGDATGAKRWFDLIMTDAQTPAATRSRVEMLMAVGTGASSG